MGLCTGKSMAQKRLLVGEVPRIVGLDSDPVLRNLLITQCYHDLSKEIARVLGDTNVNWCTFATWASRTAGGFIRNDEVPGILRKALEDSPGFRKSAQRITGSIEKVHPDTKVSPEGLLGLADEVVLDVSRQITAGNLKVFAELGPVFARFIGLFERGFLDEVDAAELADSLKVGPSSAGGQTVLKEALEHFYAAARTDDPKAKADQMLMANAKTGLHEQIRLQPFIAGSLDAPIDDVAGKLWRKHAAGGAPTALLGRIHAVWDKLGAVLTHDVEKVWVLVATKELMTLKVPGQTLDLGGTLPPIEGQPLYPEALQSIHDAEAVELLEHYLALDPDDTGEVGADDWTALAQRMRYIIALFRSRQQTAALYRQPFEDQQHAAILDGKTPGGSLD